MSKKPRAVLQTYSTDDGSKIKEKRVYPRICWGEESRSIEIVLDKKKDRETAVFIPLRIVVDQILEHITEK